MSSPCRYPLEVVLTAMPPTWPAEDLADLVECHRRDAHRMPDEVELACGQRRSSGVGGPTRLTGPPVIRLTVAEHPGGVLGCKSEGLVESLDVAASGAGDCSHAAASTADGFGRAGDDLSGLDPGIDEA